MNEDMKCKYTLISPQQSRRKEALDYIKNIFMEESEGLGPKRIETILDLMGDCAQCPPFLEVIGECMQCKNIKN